MNFLKLIKKFIKTFFYSILNREGKKIKFYSNLLLTNKFHLLDIGAAGEINNRWMTIEKNIIFNLAEPHKESAIELKNKGYNVIEKIFYNKENLNLTLYETKDPKCSSIIKPNLEHINNFSKSERFEIQKKLAPTANRTPGYGVCRVTSCFSKLGCILIRKIPSFREQT